MAKRCILIADTLGRLENLGKEEIAYYVERFPNKLDYNIAQDGNLLTCYNEIRELMESAGYKVERYTDEKIWNYYKKIVGKVVDDFFYGY